MIKNNILKLKCVIRYDVVCDECGNEYSRTGKLIKESRKRFDIDVCVSCAAKKSINKKPQCNKDFWTDEIKILHNVKSKNEAYYESIKFRDQKGDKNGMFGKKHNDYTKKLMASSRTGKIGEKATAWKGGKNSFNNRIKSTLQKRYKWFSRVIQRDKKCLHCGSNKKLDAHHIYPISKIIKELTQILEHIDENDLYLKLIEHERIMDSELKNGICLCRGCHMKVHNQWGSHNAEVL